MSQLNHSVRREKTAIRRYRCSRPVAVALAEGLISRSTSVLDYGCGHGADVAYLTSKRIRARGWDPHHHPERRSLRPADVVNLGFVLNVIEDPTERAETLCRAYSLARRLLVVSVRVDRALDQAQQFGDGLLTGSGTFQKLYSQAEFREYVEGILARRPTIAALGVLYVFKDARLEREHLADRTLLRQVEYRTEIIEQFTKNAAARAFVVLGNRLGRTPLPEEFPRYPMLLEQFGSRDRIERLLRRYVDRDAFESARDRKREYIVTYLAMLRLQGLGAPPAKILPESVREDIKACWRSYGEARAEAERFLFSLGQPETVRAGCEASPVGKRLPTELYVHRTAEPELPPLLRVLLFAAQQVVGQVDYDIARMATDGRSVAFLAYDGFDENPHPPLRYSVKIHLPTSSYDIRDYREHLNPPIIHRKDAFVSAAHPRYAQFLALTRQEESLGLLSSPDIGHRQQWEALLVARGLTVRNHELVPAGHAMSEVDARRTN